MRIDEKTQHLPPSENISNDPSTSSDNSKYFKLKPNNDPSTSLIKNITNSMKDVAGKSLVCLSSLIPGASSNSIFRSNKSNFSTLEILNALEKNGSKPLLKRLEKLLPKGISINDFFSVETDIGKQMGMKIQGKSIIDIKLGGSVGNFLSRSKFNRLIPAQLLPKHSI